MRDEHLTALVLAAALVLVAFALGDVPSLLLPPVLHSAGPGRARATLVEDAPGSPTTRTRPE